MNPPTVSGVESDLRRHEPFKSILRKRDDHDLKKSAQDIKQLMGHPGWLALQQLLAERKGQVQADLTLITDKLSHQQMTRIVGYMAGLDAALDGAQAVGIAAAERDQENANAARAAERSA